MPTEIVIMVADLADLPSASALSLTCKTLHFKLKFLYSGLSRTTAPYLERQQIERDRMEFLRRLERDSPNTGPLCHYCRLLGHHPVETWYSYGPQVSRSCSSNFRVYPSCLSLGPWSYSLEFHQAYMVLNRHLYGASFGLPLSFLSKSTDWQAKTPLDALWEHPGTFQRSGWFRKLDVEANIQDNQIFLHTCQRIWFPSKQRDSLRKHGLGGVYVRACPHTTTRTDPPSVRSAIESSLSKLPKKASRETSKYLPAKATHGEFYQCPSCSTEFTVSICDDSEYGIEIIVDVWHNLGSCRAFDDLGWVNVVEGFMTEVDVRQDITFHERRWHESCRDPPYVSYVLDAVPGLPVSASAMDHPSSRAVLQAWGRPNHWKRRIAVLKKLLWR